MANEIQRTIDSNDLRDPRPIGGGPRRSRAYEIRSEATPNTAPRDSVHPRLAERRQYVTRENRRRWARNVAAAVAITGAAVGAGALINSRLDNDRTFQDPPAGYDVGTPPNDIAPGVVDAPAPQPQDPPPQGE